MKPRPGQPRRALPYRAMPCLPCSAAQGVSQVPPKPDPKSDHELTTEALRLAHALDVVAADRDRRDMTSLHERLLLCRVVKGTPDAGVEHRCRSVPRVEYSVPRSIQSARGDWCQNSVNVGTVRAAAFGASAV
jgi:hypothetical protein